MPKPAASSKREAKSPSPFSLALAARRGDIPKESLTGAAKLLFKDKSLTQDQLARYAKPPERRTERSFGRIHRMRTKT